MSDINVVTFTGRLGGDPEIRHTQSGDQIASFSVAIGKSWNTPQGKQERTSWIKVACFKGLAGVAGQYLAKGSRVAISGELRENKWQDQQGNNRSQIEVVAQSMTMLDSRDQQQPAQGDYGQPPAQQPQQQFVPDQSVSDDDIPF
jgi:single-strand DNA-binding protein